MGARPIDYKLSTPPNSVIHVEDFTSPKDLAEYLLKLDTNDDLYNEYLKWKGTGSFINTKFWCRLCAMAHDTSRKTWYTDISKWWRGQGVCTTAKDKKWASWKNTKQDNKEPNPFVVIKQNTPGWYFHLFGLFRSAIKCKCNVNYPPIMASPLMLCKQARSWTIDLTITYYRVERRAWFIE